MTYTGTVAFTAPVIINIFKYLNIVYKIILNSNIFICLHKEVFEGVYNEKVDVWSAGVVLYVMLSGKEPFENEYVKDLII